MQLVGRGGHAGEERGAGGRERRGKVRRRGRPGGANPAGIQLTFFFFFLKLLKASIYTQWEGCFLPDR